MIIFELLSHKLNLFKNNTKIQKTHLNNSLPTQIFPIFSPINKNILYLNNQHGINLQIIQYKQTCYIITNMSKTVQQYLISLTSSDQTMKVLLIGNSGVGKSNMLTRYTENKFNHNMLNTIGVDFKVKYLDVRGQKIKLVLWDTAGQERFRTITNGYYRGADGIVIVYDLTDRESFDNVAVWYKEMKKSVSENVVCLLVGNKVDMDCRRVVTKEEGYQLAQQYGMPFAETSAKTSENISDIFESLTERLVLNSPIRSNSRPILPAALRIDPLSNPSEEEHCTCCST